MTEPLVACVILTKDRPAMARQAVESFRQQTYGEKRLLIIDTGDEPYGHVGSQDSTYYTGSMYRFGVQGVGGLRNIACGEVKPCTGADIICHWDDDDISHPNRIAEQVALLQSSGADAVGYREVLFWDTRMCLHHLRNIYDPLDGNCRCGGEAWIYKHDKPNYAIGASLCYWRKTWESVPFPDKTIGEDSEWLWNVTQAGGKVVGISATHRYFAGLEPGQRTAVPFDEPRMICRIHGHNTSNAYCTAAMEGERAKDYWRRAPEFDAYAKGVCG